MLFEQERLVTELWKFAEIRISGPSEGNPFLEQQVDGVFTSAHDVRRIKGFYDGNGCYCVRFMPMLEETYTYEITCSFCADVWKGKVEVLPAKKGNHGMVHTANQYHFRYSDGTAYYPFGTTCYVWNHQKEELQKQTLETLKEGYFNKIRFCVFPKHYDYNFHEPISYPYAGTPCDSSQINKDNFQQYNGCAEGNAFDYSYFNVKHFQNLDRAILELDALGIEADLILLHPYDRWGFSQMSREQDDQYFRYMLARYSSFKNVWWSLANEYDILSGKSLADWERLGKLLCEEDPYDHLRSIHNCIPFYDHTAPWITHCCLQRQDRFRTGEYTDEWRMRFKKPIIIDEIAYEGNIQHGWGNISGQEITRRYWETICRGGYAGHGETYLDSGNILWWSHGGVLRGESPKRLRFAKELLESLNLRGLRPVTFSWDETAACEEAGFAAPEVLLFYYGFQRPSFRDYHLDDTTSYEVELVDTWNMTRETIGTFKGKFTVPMPAREYMLVILKRAENQNSQKN